MGEVDTARVGVREVDTGWVRVRGQAKVKAGRRWAAIQGRTERKRLKAALSTLREILHIRSSDGA